MGVSTLGARRRLGSGSSGRFGDSVAAVGGFGCSHVNALGACDFDDAH